MGERIIGQEQEISSHYFEFGFRYPIVNSKAKIYTPNDGANWNLTFPPPLPSDTVWYGNCVQDALLSVNSLRSCGIESSILEIHVDSLGNSPRGFSHYRAVTSKGYQVDHSRFFRQYINENTTGYRARVLNGNEEKNLRQRHTPVDGRLVEKAYSEILVNGSPVLFEVSIWRGDDDLRIGFDITQPDADHPDYRAYLPISRGLVHKRKLGEMIDNFEFLITYGHPGQDGFAPNLIRAAMHTICPNVLTELKRYFHEIVKAIPL